MARISLRDARVFFRDATPGTPEEIEIKIGDGNLTWDENRALEYINDRGILSERREDEDQAMAVSIDFNWDYIRGKNAGGEPPSPVDVLKHRYNAAAWISTDPDECQPFAIDIVIEYTPNCTGTDTNETIILPKFAQETLAFDLDAGSIACTGTCLAIEAISNRTDG